MDIATNRPADTITTASLLALAMAEPEELLGLRTRWTAAEILAAVFPEPTWLVPNRIPTGLVMLGGRPKIGKSWLALQMAIAVGSGGRVFGEILPKGRVLYLAFEDSPRRLQARMQKQLAGNPNITFHTAYMPFTEGGMTKLQAEISTGGYTLVVIDTFARAIAGKRRIDNDDSGDMTSIMGELQTIATTLDTTILILDHHRKTNGLESSPIDEILGATAKSAVADCVMGIFRAQGKKGATLKITGRDVEEQELALDWDGKFCCWQFIGDASDVRKDSLKSDILTAIRALKEDSEAPTTTRIAKFLNKEKSNVSVALSDLVMSGKVRRGEKVGREVPFVEVS